MSLGTAMAEAGAMREGDLPPVDDELDAALVVASAAVDKADQRKAEMKAKQDAFDRLKYDRSNAAEWMDILAKIAAFRAALNADQNGTVELALSVHGKQKLVIQIGSDTAFDALETEDKYALVELKNVGVSFGEWA